MVTGSCLCGSVSFELTGPLRDSISCHCSQCRKTSGHYFAATQLPTENLRVLSEATLKWYASSDTARRAFCAECGSSLFWQKTGDAAISVASGSLDSPTGLQTAKHIFTQDKGDYYDIP